MTVEKLIESYPKTAKTGRCIPCSDNQYVILNHIGTKEYLAIYILYDYKHKRLFLPSTVLSYCQIPEKTLGKAYESIMAPFLRQMTMDRFYFHSGKLYEHYTSEIKTIFDDLCEGGNYHATREMALELWVHFRALFREEAFSTMGVVEANPVLCRKHNLTYAGPLLF